MYITEHQKSQRRYPWEVSNIFPTYQGQEQSCKQHCACKPDVQKVVNCQSFFLISRDNLGTAVIFQSSLVIHQFLVKSSAVLHWLHYSFSDTHLVARFITGCKSYSCWMPFYCYACVHVQRCVCHIQSPHSYIHLHVIISNLDR